MTSKVQNVTSGEYLVHTVTNMADDVHGRSGMRAAYKGMYRSRAYQGGHTQGGIPGHVMPGRGYQEGTLGHVMPVRGLRRAL